MYLLEKNFENAIFSIVLKNWNVMKKKFNNFIIIFLPVYEQNNALIVVGGMKSLYETSAIIFNVDSSIV